MIYINEIMDDPRNPGKILFEGSEDLPFHWHNNIEICYYLKGGFSAHLDDRLFEVRDGDVMIINSCQMHYLGHNSFGKNKGVSVVANMEYWKSMCTELDSMEFDLSLAPEHVGRLRELMRQLYDSSLMCYNAEETTGKTDRTEMLKINATICLIYYELVRHFCILHNSAAYQNTTAQQSNIREIVQFINEHYTEHLTLTELSAATNMSREHISRIFKKGLGLNYKDYLTQLRIAHACKLLKNSDLNLTEIALESGFPNVKALNEQFVKSHGRTPREYRQM